MANREVSRMPTAADMEVTPERALMIKRALLRQYADQMGIDVVGWEETKDGVKTVFKIINDKAVRMADGKETDAVC